VVKSLAGLDKAMVELGGQNQGLYGEKWVNFTKVFFFSPGFEGLFDRRAVPDSGGDEVCGRLAMQVRNDGGSSLVVDSILNSLELKGVCIFFPTRCMADMECYDNTVVRVCRRWR